MTILKMTEDKDDKAERECDRLVAELEKHLATKGAMEGRYGELDKAADEAAARFSIAQTSGGSGEKIARTAKELDAARARRDDCMTIWNRTKGRIQAQISALTYPNLIAPTLRRWSDESRNIFKAHRKFKATPAAVGRHSGKRLPPFSVESNEDVLAEAQERLQVAMQQLRALQYHSFAEIRRFIDDFENELSILDLSATKTIEDVSATDVMEAENPRSEPGKLTPAYLKAAGTSSKSESPPPNNSRTISRNRGGRPRTHRSEKHGTGFKTDRQPVRPGNREIRGS